MIWTIVAAVGPGSRVRAASCTVPVDSGCATIQAALDQANAGDTISVNTGTYFEKINVPAGGSAGNPVTLKAGPGQAPILDGTGVAGAHMIFIDGSTTARNYIVIQGFEIRNNTGVNDGSGIRLVGASTGVEIRGNEIHEIRGKDAMGITVYGTRTTSISNLIIDGNNVHDCDPARSEAITLNGNVENFQVTNNTVRDVNNIGIDCIGGEASIQSNPALVCRNGWISGNTVIRANSIYDGGFAGGIYVDGGDGNTIENNVVTGSDFGLEIGAENASQIAEFNVVRNNVFYENEKAGFVFGGFAASVGRVNNNEFRGNTLYHNNTLGPNGQGRFFKGNGVGEIWVQYAGTNVVADNIVYAGAENVFVVSELPGSSAGNSLDYNLFYSTPGAATGAFSLNGTQYAGLVAWQVGTGQDANSVTGDPLFVNAGSANFHISTASPAVNVGDPAYVATPSAFAPETDLDGLTRVVGAAVDIGADEGTCGNGTVDGGEACDDGNTVDCDGCDSNCTLSSTCGNGVTCGAEACDDGNTSNGDCCSSTCAFEVAGSVCSDQDACTTADQCDGAGVCAGTSVGGPGCALATGVRKCQEAIARSARRYADTRLKSLQKCRNDLNRGKALYTDAGGTVPVNNPANCATEFRTAARIAKMGAKMRVIIARPGKEKCTDTLLATLSACSVTVNGLVTVDGTAGCLVSGQSATIDVLLGDEYGNSLTGNELDFVALRKCQEAVARAARTYASTRLKGLQKCRKSLNKGRVLYADAAKTLPLTNPADCNMEFKGAARLLKAGLRARTIVEGKCNNTLLSSLASLCATTVNGLVTATGDGGCIITGHDSGVDALIDAQY